jgi:hypothetical protein
MHDVRGLDGSAAFALTEKAAMFGRTFAAWNAMQFDLTHAKD